MTSESKKIFAGCVRTRVVLSKSLYQELARIGAARKMSIANCIRQFLHNRLTEDRGLELSQRRGVTFDEPTEPGRNFNFLISIEDRDALVQRAKELEIKVSTYIRQLLIISLRVDGLS